MILIQLTGYELFSLACKIRNSEEYCKDCENRLDCQLADNKILGIEKDYIRNTGAKELKKIEEIQVAEVIELEE